MPKDPRIACIGAGFLVLLTSVVILKQQLHQEQFFSDRCFRANSSSCLPTANNLSSPDPTRQASPPSPDPKGHASTLSPGPKGQASPPSSIPGPSVSISIVKVGTTMPTADDSGRLPRVRGGEICKLPWAQKYAALHADIVSGSAPPRFLVTLFPPSGLADRLLPSITHLYWALLTGRALQLVENTDSVYLSDALDATCIQWGVRRGAYSPRYFDRALAAFRSSKGKETSILASDPRDFFVGDNRHALITFYQNNLLATDFYTKVNLLTQPKGLNAVPFLFVHSNRGRTIMLWGNENHRDSLQALAPASESFKLAWNFLFTPTPATLAAMEPYANQLDACDNCTVPNLIVAVHIRTKDTAFSKPLGSKTSQAALMARYRPFFECAQEVGKNAKPGQKVVWFLASDDLEIRRAAAASYGDVLVANTESPSVHFGKVKKKTPSAAVSVMTDIYLMAKAQFHVLSLTSGFGKIGAYLSDGVGAHIALGQRGRGCVSSMMTREHDSLIGYWSGMR
jgi:hypothetical protein